MGFTVETIVPGDGKTFPRWSDKVTIHYVGTLEGIDHVFGSSRDSEPLQFSVGFGQVIKGLDEGIQMVSLGEKAKITCTYDYGFGERGYPGLIPPCATLLFEVELLRINTILETFDPVLKTLKGSL